MAEGNRMGRWVAAFCAGVVVAGLGAFLLLQRSLDKADKWASVFGL
ncbi:hypothetical protein AB0J80_38265 [Actinoplanes sp. NPDC049548]